jgi:phage shock protein A
MPYYPHYAGPPREDYVRMLEDERGMLEQRLRRLERELAELRQSSAPAAREPTS